MIATQSDDSGCTTSGGVGVSGRNDLEKSDIFPHCDYGCATNLVSFAELLQSDSVVLAYFFLVKLPLGDALVILPRRSMEHHRSQRFWPTRGTRFLLCLVNFSTPSACEKPRGNGEIAQSHRQRERGEKWCFEPPHVTQPQSKYNNLQQLLAVAFVCDNNHCVSPSHTKALAYNIHTSEATVAPRKHSQHACALTSIDAPRGIRTNST